MHASTSFLETWPWHHQNGCLVDAFLAAIDGGKTRCAKSGEPDAFATSVRSSIMDQASVSPAAFPRHQWLPYWLFHQDVGVSHLPFRTNALIYIIIYIHETVYDSLLQMERREVPCRQILAPFLAKKCGAFFQHFLLALSRFDPCCSILVFLAFWSAFEFSFFFLIFTMPPSKSSKLVSCSCSIIYLQLALTLAAEDMASMMAAMAGKMGPVPPRPFVGKGGKAPLGTADWWVWWDNSVQGWWRWWCWCFAGCPSSG